MDQDYADIVRVRSAMVTRQIQANLPGAKPQDSTYTKPSKKADYSKLDEFLPKKKSFRNLETNKTIHLDLGEKKMDVEHVRCIFCQKLQPLSAAKANV
jgi:hypothetical protein